MSMQICMDCHSQNWSRCMCSSALKQGGRCDSCNQFKDSVTQCFSTEPVRPPPATPKQTAEMIVAASGLAAMPVTAKATLIESPLMEIANKLAEASAQVKFQLLAYEGAKKNLDQLAEQLNELRARENELKEQLKLLLG